MPWTQQPTLPTPFNRAVSAPEVTGPRFEKDCFKSPGSFFVSPHLGSSRRHRKKFPFFFKKKRQTMDPLIGKTHWVSPQTKIWHRSTAPCVRKEHVRRSDKEWSPCRRHSTCSEPEGLRHRAVYLGISGHSRGVRKKPFPMIH